MNSLCNPPNSFDDVLTKTINEIPQLTQVQYGLEQQLRELRVAANRLGLRDAADFITKFLRGQS